MMWRRVACLTIVTILVLGMLSLCLAMDIPGKGEPSPRPRQWGDPDWPASARHSYYAVEIGDDSPVGRSPEGLAGVEGEPSTDSDHYDCSARDCLRVEAFGLRIRLRR